MRLFSLTTLLFFATSSVGAAQCAGSDMRATLTGAERAELQTRLDAVPFAEGLYWTATRGEQSLHILGTVHLNDPRLSAIVQRIAPVIAQADQVYAEMTDQEMAALNQALVARPELAFLTEGPTLPELLPEDEWQDLASHARERGLPGVIVSKMRPWYLMVTLSMPACALAQTQSGDRGLDGQVLQMAKDANVPAQALEPYDTLFTLFNGFPLQDQLDQLRMGVLPNAMAEDALATLFASYFEEKPAEAFEMNRIMAYRQLDLPRAEIDASLDEMLGLLLDQRNRAWMQNLLAAPNGTSVIAVGAGHLPGEAGLLNLLKQAGFTLSRQPLAH